MHGLNEGHIAPYFNDMLHTIAGRTLIYFLFPRHNATQPSVNPHSCSVNENEMKGLLRKDNLPIPFGKIVFTLVESLEARMEFLKVLTLTAIVS